jgi:uroporphyrin-3 C-methyltransferase
VAELETALARARRDLEAASARQQAALREFAERQEAARAATEAALRESLSRVARQAPPSTGEWRRAEVQYLLRIANHRLLMEGDVAGALRLLQAADTVLAELDDFALHEVRARLADEIAALERVEGADLQGLFVRLETLKHTVDELPARLPEYVAPEPEAPPAPEGFWQTLSRELGRLVEVRELEGAVKPLLAPEEAVYLELNLRLMLERAQLAAVRREQLVYDESLAAARAWVRDYLDTSDPAVRRMLDELEALQGVELDRPLPDVSGSLTALREALRTAS